MLIIDYLHYSISFPNKTFNNYIVHILSISLHHVSVSGCVWYSG